MPVIEIAPKLTPMRKGGNPVLQIIEIIGNERCGGNSLEAISKMFFRPYLRWLLVSITLFTKILPHDK
jgi:hypothetical protein